jgi:hypothetical protein
MAPLHAGEASSLCQKRVENTEDARYVEEEKMTS